MQNSSPILARQWWRHFRLSLSLSLCISLSLSPNVPHAQYRKRFRASYNSSIDDFRSSMFPSWGWGQWKLTYPAHCLYASVAQKKCLLLQQESVSEGASPLWETNQSFHPWTANTAEGRAPRLVNTKALSSCIAVPVDERFRSRVPGHLVFLFLHKVLPPTFLQRQSRVWHTPILLYHPLVVMFTHLRSYCCYPKDSAKS